MIFKDIVDSVIVLNEVHYKKREICDKCREKMFVNE
jgi:hypothetical protein